MYGSDGAYYRFVQIYFRIQDWANDHTMDMEIRVEPKENKPSADKPDPQNDKSKTHPNSNHRNNPKNILRITANHDKNSIEHVIKGTRKGSQQQETELGHVNKGMSLD